MQMNKSDLKRASWLQDGFELDSNFYIDLSGINVADASIDMNNWLIRFSGNNSSRGRSRIN